MKVIKPNQSLTKSISNFLHSRANDLGVAKNLSKVNNLKTVHYSSENSRKSSAYAVISSITVGSAAFMFGLTYGLICPAVQPDSTSAESASTEVTASIDDIIAISAPTSASITITPKADGSVFATTSIDVSVTTNNAYGYQLTMGTSGTDSSGNLTTSLIENTISTSSSTISISSITTSISNITTSNYDDFTDNSWGFTTNNNGTDTSTGQIVANTYNPLTTTTSPTLIKSTDTTATANTTTVTFAVKINDEQPAGTYTNTIVFSATANPDPEPLAHISTMQQMTSEICSANPTYEDNGKTYTLTDTRDNNTYQVRKLKDGNCWMAENLALGTSDENGITLTPNDSDVSSNWTLPAYNSVGDNWAYDGISHTIQGSITTDSNWVEGMGNWYTYDAATAGSGTNLTSGDATDSICPKGWQLFVADSSLESGSGFSSTLNKSLGNLFRNYGLTSSSIATSVAIRSEPLSFTFAGAYYDGKTNRVGTTGHYYSSTAGGEKTVYYMELASNSVDPQYNYSRNAGLSVRCVAQ